MFDTVLETLIEFNSKAMLNGAGMMHGGCLAYLIDKYVSFPL